MHAKQIPKYQTLAVSRKAEVIVSCVSRVFPFPFYFFFGFPAYRRCLAERSARVQRARTKRPLEPTQLCRDAHNLVRRLQI